MGTEYVESPRMLSLKPMRPGVHIMRQLRLPTKLGLLALVLLVPMLVVGVLLVQRVNESIRFTEAEVDGSKLVQLSLIHI